MNFLRKIKSGAGHQNAKLHSKKIKEILTSDLSLTHYDPKLDIIVASDASSYGIGACILHKLPDGCISIITTWGKTILADREGGIGHNFCCD